MTDTLKAAHPIIQADAVIIGGGMVGLSLGIALARAGVRVALVEQSALAQQLEPAFDGRVSAIAAGSQRLLDAIGAWPAMAPNAEPIRDIRVSDGDSPFFVHYDHQAVGEPFGYIVENRYIRHALQALARTLPTLTLVERTKVQAITVDNGGVTVQLENHDPLRCRLLIGADGKQSPVRTLAGIGVSEWEYGQTAIVCTIRHEHPHHGLAQERFLPAGPFAVLPMQVDETGAHRSSLVWVEPTDRAPLYLALPEAELAQEISERAGDYLGEIEVAGPRFSYPLSLTHAKTYIGRRLALVGDAAHSIHPIAGQGVNLGFRDVGALSELVLARFRLGLDIGNDDTLYRYQRRRYGNNTAMLGVTDGLNRLFSHTIPPIKLARGLGLWGVQHMPKLKRVFMREAMGVEQ